MAITIKEIQVSTKVTQQKKEPDLPLSRDLIQQIKEEIIREAVLYTKVARNWVVSPSKSIRIAIS